MKLEGQMGADIIAIQKTFEDLQQQYLKLQQSKSKLVDLQHENTVALESVEALKPECQIYQTVGPAMLPRLHEDVKTALKEKLAFVKKQIEAANAQLQALEKQIKEVNKERIQIAQANKAKK